MTDDSADAGPGVSRRRHWRKLCLAVGGVLAAGGLVFGGAMIGVLTRPPARPALSGPRGYISSFTHTMPSASPPTGPAMTTAQIVAALRTMLPPASTISYIRGSSSAEIPGVSADYNDGQGNVDFDLAIWPSALDALTPLNCSESAETGSQDNYPPPAGGLAPSCVERELPGGGTEQDLVSGADGSGFYVYQVTLRRPDGVEVIVKVANTYLCWGSGECPADPAFLPRPPGSMAEWEAVAESPVWHL